MFIFFSRIKQGCVSSRSFTCLSLSSDCPSILQNLLNSYNKLDRNHNLSEMSACLPMNLLKLFVMFVLTWPVGSTPPLSNSGLIQLKKLWKSIERIGLLPASSQKVILKTVGEEYVKQNITHCNVFGGGESCISISDSNYIKSCTSKYKLEDCVFSIDLSTFGDPSLALPQYAGAGDHTICDGCHGNFEKFFCAVAAPPCGTVNKVLDEIPSFLSSVASKMSSMTISLQKAVPRIINAASLGFPCKVMCETVIDSCGCSQQPTFGEVMDAIVIDSQLHIMNTTGLSIRELFTSIWDKQVCDLFLEESTPGFSGVCIPLNQTAKCGFCNGGERSSTIQKEVVKHGILKLSQMVLRLLEGGLQEILSEMEKPKHVNSNVGQATSPSNQRKRSRTGAVVLVVIFMAFVISSFVASVRLSRNHQVAYQYIDLSSVGYTPPVL